MKISMTPISLSRTIREGKMNLESFVEYCAELELDGVDILSTNHYAWLWKEPQKELVALPGIIERSGLKLAAWAAGNNFAVTDPDAFDAQVEGVKQALREAGDCGAPVLRIFGGTHADWGGEPGIVDHNGLELVVRGIEKCLPDAEKSGVIMALENHGGLPRFSYEMAAIIDIFDSPWLRAMFDCGNFMSSPKNEPENTLTAYQNLRGLIAHVHAKDFGPSMIRNRDMHGYVAGRGIVPIRQFAALLEQDNFEGYCSLEYEAGVITPELHGVPESIEFLKGIRTTHKMFKKLKSERSFD